MVSGCQRLGCAVVEGGRRDEQAEKNGLKSSKTTLYDTRIMSTCHFILVKIHRMYNIKSELSCKLWTLVVIMCQCWFISCNQCTPLVGKVGSEGGHARGGQLCGNSVPSSKFCCEPNTALKNQVH